MEIRVHIFENTNLNHIIVMFCSIRRDLWSQVLLVHLRNIRAVTKKREENQEDQSQGLREGRKRNGTDQDRSIIIATLAVKKRLMGLCGFLDFSRLRKDDFSLLFFWSCICPLSALNSVFLVFLLDLWNLCDNVTILVDREFSLPLWWSGIVIIFVYAVEVISKHLPHLNELYFFV